MQIVISFQCNVFTDQCLSYCLFSFSHYIVSTSIWYLQTFVVPILYKHK